MENPKVKGGGGGGVGLGGVKSGFRTKGLITLAALARFAAISPAPWLNATKIV